MWDKHHYSQFTGEKTETEKKRLSLREKTCLGLWRSWVAEMGLELIRSSRYSFINFVDFVCGNGMNQTQVLIHGRQVLFYWAIYHVLLLFPFFHSSNHSANTCCAPAVFLILYTWHLQLVYLLFHRNSLHPWQWMSQQGTKESLKSTSQEKV